MRFAVLGSFALMVISLLTFLAWHGPLPMTLGSHDSSGSVVSRCQHQARMRAVREREWEWLTSGAFIGCVCGSAVGLLLLSLNYLNRRNRRRAAAERRQVVADSSYPQGCSHDPNFTPLRSERYFHRA
jgi:hypothetical protein